jgi:DNA-directed RNA polymerase subunit L
MVIPLQDAAAAQLAAVELTKDDKTLVELLTEYMKQQGKVP